MLSYSATVSADGTLLTAPTSGYYKVYGWLVTSAGNPGLCLLKDGSTRKDGCSSFTSSGGGAQRPVTGTELWNGSHNTALTWTQATQAVSVDVTVNYELVKVF